MCARVPKGRGGGRSTVRACVAWIGRDEGPTLGNMGSRALMALGRVC